MMKKFNPVRKPTDDCLLCKRNRAEKTKSHFIPNCLLKRSAGDRDKEESYSFDLITGKREEFLGIENPKGWSEDENTPTNTVLHHFAGDYFFCPTCEAILSQLEGELCGEFTGIKEYSNKHPEQTKQMSRRKVVQIRKKIFFEKFMAFVYSVIWRASLQKEYFDNNPVFFKSESEDFRKALFEYLYYERVERIQNLARRYSLAILHPESQSDRTNNDFFTMGTGQVKFFLLFEFLFVLYKDSTKETSLVFKNFFKDDRIIISSNPTISLVEGSLWQQMLNVIRSEIYPKILHSIQMLRKS